MDRNKTEGYGASQPRSEFEQAAAANRAAMEAAHEALANLIRSLEPCLRQEILTGAACASEDKAEAPVAQIIQEMNLSASSFESIAARCNMIRDRLVF